MNTSLRIIGTPDELRQTLFTRSLAVVTVAPLDSPAEVFRGLPAVTGWKAGDPAAGRTGQGGGSTARCLPARRRCRGARHRPPAPAGRRHVPSVSGTLPSAAPEAVRCGPPGSGG